jgi:hypothetical protein
MHSDKWKNKGILSGTLQGREQSVKKVKVQPPGPHNISFFQICNFFPSVKTQEQLGNIPDLLTNPNNF